MSSLSQQRNVGGQNVLDTGRDSGIAQVLGCIVLVTVVSIVIKPF